MNEKDILKAVQLQKEIAYGQIFQSVEELERLKETDPKRYQKEKQQLLNFIQKLQEQNVKELEYIESKLRKWWQFWK